MDLGQGAAEVIDKGREGVLRRYLGATDQDVIPTWMAEIGENMARNLTQAAFRAIARDRIANLLRTGETDSDLTIVCATTGLQHKTTSCRAFCPRRRQEV